MKRSLLFVTALSAAVCAAPAGAQTAHLARHRAAHPHAALVQSYARRPYSSRVSPTITCRYPDGTPYDPDIIGGPNHVGDGGPAANLGGFYPCAY